LVAASFAAVVEVGADYKDEHTEGPPLSVSAAALGIPQDRVMDLARKADAWWKGQDIAEDVDFGTGEVVPDEPPAVGTPKAPSTEAAAEEAPAADEAVIAEGV
jgi:hypothetical protein